MRAGAVIDSEVGTGRYISHSLLERDDFPSNRHPTPTHFLVHDLSENRYPPRITSGADSLSIML
jgi:hypothetical protein